jgi:hypothetical protein
MGFFSALFGKQEKESVVNEVRPQKEQFKGYRDKAYFRQIITEEFPEFEVRADVSPESLGLRREQVYRDRAGEYPSQNFDLGLFNGGEIAAVVMVTGPGKGALAVFKNTRETAQANKIPFVNFYIHFPSEREYVVERIMNALYNRIVTE